MKPPDKDYHDQIHRISVKAFIFIYLYDLSSQIIHRHYNYYQAVDYAVDYAVDQAVDYDFDQVVDQYDF